MNTSPRTLFAAAALCAAAGAAQAQGLAQVPLFLAPAINPNVLVMLDNSQSMDAAMGGKVLSGDDPTTRSNVARSVLRDILANYRYSFNWGLGSFGLAGTPALSDIYAYYLGNAETMVYTPNCSGIVDGVGVSDIVGLHAVVTGGVATWVDGPLPCIQDPEPGSALGYLTYARSGDDGDINDVTYLSGGFPGQVYGIGTSDPTTYRVLGPRTEASRTTGRWLARDFVVDYGRFRFSATDSGWLADSTEMPRRLWTRRGWGYNNDITGLGTINEAVVDVQNASSSVEAAHFASLSQLLVPEDTVPTSASLKNAASSTPLAGTVLTSRNYFAGELPGKPSPIAASCQANYVVLATDGNPTGRIDGSQYNPSDWVNSKDADGKWIYGPAIVDVLDQITALRATARGSETFDIRTYVIGMGSTVANPSSVASLHEMARAGGTDMAFLASDSDALRTAFQAVTANIQSKAGAGASASVNSAAWQTNAALYQGKFNSTDWSGDLLAYAVQENGALASTPNWSAAERLNARNWDSGRAILSYKPSTGGGVAFRWPADPAAPTATDLDAAQVAVLNRDAGGSVDGLGAQRLAYLRGDASLEARNNCESCVFRNRPTTVLGDIVDSAPTYLGAPAANYYADFESVPYASFAATWRTRTPTLYVGANDGMLHAFDATTGEETFAYVPNLVFGSLSALTAQPFTHRFNVDGTPAVADVFYADNWHTLLVAGLRGGGRGLYALDVTDPGAFTESDAARVARWEFADTDMGHVFAPPMLVKTNNGRWSVITGNGYENAGSGRAWLYVIDAETGAIVRKIEAGTATGNGLSGAAAIDVNGDGVADVAYAGDLTGKLWKFDLSAATPADWGLAIGGAALFDAGASKPITAKPDVTRSPKGGYLVVFGTGRYLSTGDPSITATQSAYGIWDRDSTVVTADRLQVQIIETATASAGGDTYRFSSHRVGPPADTKIDSDEPTITPETFYATRRGWMLDLPTAGERIVADARIRGGRAIFTSMIPAIDDPCRFGGSGWILEFDVFTGNRLDGATFDVNNNGTLSTEDFLAVPGSSTGGATNTSGWQINGVPSAPAFMGFRNDSVNTEIKYVNTSDGVLVQKREAAGTGGEGRVMWRVVQ